MNGNAMGYAYRYEISREMLEAFTAPALLADTDYTILAKNEHARRQFGSLRIGSSLKNSVSEGSAAEMSALRPGERLRVSLIIDDEIYGGIVQRCRGCYALKIMTSSSLLVKRLAELSPRFDEKQLLEYFDFGSHARADGEYLAAIERIYAKRERLINKLSFQVGQFIGMSRRSSVYGADTADLRALVEEVEKNMLKYSPAIANKFSYSYRSRNCWAAVNRRDFQSVLVLLLEFAYTYMAGRIIKVDLSETVRTFYLCVNFDCAFPKKLISSVCENNFEELEFREKYGDIFFPLAAVKMLCQVYSMDFSVCSVGGSLLQFRVEGDSMEMTEEALLNDYTYERAQYMLSPEQEKLIGEFFSAEEKQQA